jgi:uncharacterized protein
MTQIRLLLLAILTGVTLVWTVVAASAQNAEDTILRGQNKADANAGTVTIMTTRNLGAPFMQAALDLSNLLDAGERFEEMRVVPVIARGKVQNLWDILYLRGIDMGFVQTDVLEYLKNDPEIGPIKQRIRYITVMYPEEVHIIASKDVESLEDLAGRKVSINANGTGSAVVGTLLMERLGIDAELVHEDTRRAVEKIKLGELAAHFNVLGKPTQVVSNIESEGKLHLLAVPYTSEMQDIYLPSYLTSEDYPNLIPPGESVPTLAVGNVLATFNWNEKTERGHKVKRFVEAFFSRFEELLEPGYSPKWKEVNLRATVPGWQRLKAAQDWLDANASRSQVASEVDELRTQFASFLAETGSVDAADSDEAFERLFERFVEWRSKQ